MRWLIIFLINAATASAFVVNALLIRLGLRREPDPWRRTVGIGLRLDASKFGLSVFGAKMPSPSASENPSEREKLFARRFRTFLQGESAGRFALRHERFCCTRVVNQNADTILVEFSPWGEIRSILPILDDRQSVDLDSSARAKVECLIVEE